MNRRTLEPLSEAPTSVRDRVLGPCGDCRRPVIGRGVVRKDPSIRRWAAPGTSTHPVNQGPICQSCWLFRGRKTGAVKTDPSQVRAPRGPAKRPPLTEVQIRSLRQMVGACVNCGWAADDPPKPHECETE